MKNVSHKKRKFQQRLVQIGLVVVIFVMAGELIFGNYGLLRMWKIHRLKNGYQDQIARLTQEIARTTHERVSLGKQGYLERVVRKEMGYIENGETIFLLPEFP